MTARVAIVGDCQAQMLEGMFEQAAIGVTIDSFIPDFEMNENIRTDVIQRLNSADIILSQRVSEQFPLSWLTPAALKQQFGSKVIIWPNIYFDGYFPGVHYVYLDGWGKLQSPLEDYHLKQLVQTFNQGLSIGDGVEALATFGINAGDDPFSDSLAQLRARERDVDLPISDFIEDNVLVRRCMYTPNHPFNFVLAEMGRRLSRLAGISFNISVAIDYGIRLDRIYIPTFPTIRHHYGLRFDNVALYRGIDIVGVSGNVIVFGKPRSFSPAELVEQFYRIYDVAFR